MPKKTQITNYFLYDTDVENLFVGEYMLDAPGDYVKVYLLALMYAQTGNQIDDFAIAKKLSLSVDAVEKAWDYWANLGVVRKTVKDAAEGSYNIEITNLKELVFGQCAVDTAAQTQPVRRVNLDDVDISGIINDVQQLTGRLLEAGEAEAIATWMSAYDIAPDVILLGYKYCTEKGKSNRCKYVERVIRDWREKNLMTAGMVLEHLEETDKQYEVYRKIFRELGFKRNPSEPEKVLMRKWFTDYGFGLDKVLEACKKTTGISNPSVNYIDAVLTNWYKQRQAGGGEENTNSYAKIQSLYAKLREENEKKTQARRAEIFTAVPRLGDIAGELKDCGFKLAKAMLSGNTRLAEEIKKNQQELQEEKRYLLEKEGWTVNALDPIYTCPKCQDTGILEDGTTCSCYANFMKVN